MKIKKKHGSDVRADVITRQTKVLVQTRLKSTCNFYGTGATLPTLLYVKVNNFVELYYL